MSYARNKRRKERRRDPQGYATRAAAIRAAKKESK